MAWEAMFGSDPVRDFHRSHEPITVLGPSGEKVVDKMYPDPDETVIGCVIDFGAG